MDTVLVEPQPELSHASLGLVGAVKGAAVGQKGQSLPVLAPVGVFPTGTLPIEDACVGTMEGQQLGQLRHGLPADESRANAHELIILEIDLLVLQLCTVGLV